MKINYIKTIGFRKFKNVFETNLYDTTSISGKNRSGKSNVLYAIINTILNTNLTGDDSCCLINNKCDNSYGELHFTDNAGVEHTLVRGKNRYNNNKNFLILDGKPTNQKELTSQDIVDKEAIKKEITRLENEILSKETEFNETQLSMKTGKKKYLEIKTSESPKCPVCEQSIENDSKKKTIENMYNTLMLEYNKRNMLEAQIKDLKIDLTRNKCKYHSLDGDVTVQKSKRIAIAEENIKQLENEKAEIEQFNNEITLKEKNVLNAKQDIDKFNADKKLKNKGVDDLSKAIKIAQKLYISYIEEKLKLAKQCL